MAKKPKIPEMFPVKKYLTLQESMAYMNMSRDTFLKHTAGLTKSKIGDIWYYKVSELDRLIEDNITMNKVA